MTEDMMRAEAAKAEREANAIFAKIEEARGPTGPLTPAGFEARRERASGLMRRARALTAEADEMRADAAPVPTQPSPPPAPAAKSPGLAPVKPVTPLETAETVAARIINSDSAAPEKRLVTSAPKASGAAEDLEAIVARILQA